MEPGSYVEHRLTGYRGTVMEQRGSWVTIYSPHLGPLKELWFAPEGELTRLLRTEENTGLEDAMHRAGTRP